MYKTTDEIFVRINRVGQIPFIGMCGPIPNPIKLSTEICLKLVNAGIDVHQYDPATKQTMKLTRENVFDDQKFGKKKEKPVTPVKPTPVTPASSTINFKGVPTPAKVDEVKAEPVPAVAEVNADKEKAVETKVESATTEEVKEVKAEATEEKKDVVNNKFNKKK